MFISSSINNFIQTEQFFVFVPSCQFDLQPEQNNTILDALQLSVKLN